MILFILVPASLCPWAESRDLFGDPMPQEIINPSGLWIQHAKTMCLFAKELCLSTQFTPSDHFALTSKNQISLFLLVGTCQFLSKRGSHFLYATSNKPIYTISSHSCPANAYECQPQRLALHTLLSFHAYECQNPKTTTPSYPFRWYCTFKNQSIVWRCFQVIILSHHCPPHRPASAASPGLNDHPNVPNSMTLYSIWSAWSLRHRPRKFGDFFWISACLTDQANWRDCLNLWDYGMQLPALISLSGSAASQPSHGPVSDERSKMRIYSKNRKKKRSL
jgi:hypothetical protein